MTAVKKYALLPLCGLTLFCARAQMPATNYDESQAARPADNHRRQKGD